MINRDARDKIVAAIRAYLAEEITAFEFDEQLTSAAAGSKDETIHRAVHWLWFYYDDCKDHKVVLSKEGWDFFQRVVLLLESDTCPVTERVRHWSWRQLVAGLALMGFSRILWGTGWGIHLVVLSIPFGVVSIGLSLVKKRFSARPPDQTDPFRFDRSVSIRSTYAAGVSKKTLAGEARGSKNPQSAIERGLAYAGVCLLDDVSAGCSAFPTPPGPAGPHASSHFWLIAYSL